MKFGTPLSEQAKAELKEAREQVVQALDAVKNGLAQTSGNLLVHQTLQTAQNQLNNAVNSLEFIRDYHNGTGNDYYRKEAELGVHRVREAITNLKDVLRMLEVPE